LFKKSHSCSKSENEVNDNDLTDWKLYLRERKTEEDEEALSALGDFG
jgi:hypothetical protein